MVILEDHIPQLRTVKRTCINLFVDNQIIVPEKPERKGMTTGEVMSMASSAASLTTVVITLVNLLSRSNNNASK